MSDKSEQACEQDDYCGTILWVAVQFSCHSYQSQKTSGFQKSKQSCCLKWNKNKVLKSTEGFEIKMSSFLALLCVWPTNRRYLRYHPASFPVVLGDFGCDVTCQACRENSPRFQASSGHSDSANRPGYEAGYQPYLQYLRIDGIKAMSRGFSGTNKRKNLPIRLTAVEYVYSIKATRWCKMYSSSFDQIYVIIVCCEDIYSRYCLGTAFKNATMIHSPTICRYCL